MNGTYTEQLPQGIRRGVHILLKSRLANPSTRVFRFLHDMMNNNVASSNESRFRGAPNNNKFSLHLGSISSIDPFAQNSNSKAGCSVNEGSRHFTEGVSKV